MRVIAHRKSVVSQVITGLAGCVVAAGCGMGDPSTPVAPSAAIGTTVADGASLATQTAGGGSVSGVVTFPPRDQPNTFFQNLVAHYQNVLGRSPSPTYVDPEGQNVWLTEYFRFYLNGCPHAEAVRRTLLEVTSGATQAICGAETRVFPPRNLPFEFQTQLEATYRDVLRRPQRTSFVDSEGANVWLAQYLRFRVSGCDHSSAENKVFAEIAGGGVQPDCGVVDACLLRPDAKPGGPYGPVNTGTPIPFDGLRSTAPPGRQIRHYRWNCGQSGNSNCTANNPTPSFTYFKQGTLGTTSTYTVRLTVEDTAGCSNSDTTTVTVTNLYGWR